MSVASAITAALIAVKQGKTVPVPTDIRKAYGEAFPGVEGEGLVAVALKDGKGPISGRIRSPRKTTGYTDKGKRISAKGSMGGTLDRCWWSARNAYLARSGEAGGKTGGKVRAAATAEDRKSAARLYEATSAVVGMPLFAKGNGPSAKGAAFLVLTKSEAAEVKKAQRG